MFIHVCIGALMLHLDIHLSVHECKKIPWLKCDIIHSSTSYILRTLYLSIVIVPKVRVVQWSSSCLLFMNYLLDTLLKKFSLKEL